MKSFFSIWLMTAFLLRLEGGYGFSTVSNSNRHCARTASTCSTPGPSPNPSPNPSSILYSTKSKSRRSISYPPKFPLHLSATDDKDSDADADADKKEQEEEEEVEPLIAMSEKMCQRQDRLQIGYQATALVYSAVSVLHLFRQGLFNGWSLYYVLCGPSLAAGTAFILKGAASHDDRLKSETYKRLNLSLILFGGLGVSLPVLDPAHFLIPYFVVPPMLALIHGIKGYGYGVLGWDKSKHICVVFQDLGQGFQSTYSTLKTFKKESLDYLLMTAMVGSLTLVKAKQVLETIFSVVANSSSGSSSLALASQVSRLARLLLFSGIVFSLKDAADRDRLAGTTFRQLNLLSSGAFASMAFYLLKTAAMSKTTAMAGASASAFGLAALVFSGITAYNGYSKTTSEAKS